MNWIIPSLLMFFSSVLLYTLIRKAQTLKIPIEIYSLFMFGVPFIIYFFVLLFSKTTFYLSLANLVKIVFSGIFLSYLGNLFSQRSILEAPNPGYSLIISKSYIIYTSIASVFLLNSELTMKNTIAIIIILLFSTFIVLPKKQKNDKKKGKMWFVYSLGAFFCWGSLALMSKHLIDSGVNIVLLLFYLTLIVSIILFGEVKKKKVKLEVNSNKMFVMILIGIFSMLFNLFMQIGFKYSPNPGYVSAVNASSITLVTILSIFLFKDEFSIRKILGVVGVTIGLFLLFI